MEQLVDEVGGAGMELCEGGAFGCCGWDLDPGLVVQGGLESDDVSVCNDSVDPLPGAVHENVHPVAPTMVVENPFHLEKEEAGLSAIVCK